ncbi:hypothetical protein [Viscerimonas tarda]
MTNRIISAILFCVFIGSLFACSDTHTNDNSLVANPVDSIFMGNLRASFDGDSLFFSEIAPNICLTQNLYLLTLTRSDAEQRGIPMNLYRKVQNEIAKTNQIIKDGIMHGGDVKKIYDFQEYYFEK